MAAGITKTTSENRGAGGDRQVSSWPTRLPEIHHVTGA